MIEQKVKIHDKFSLEIKLSYATKKSKKNNDFIVNTWFFIPNSLDINRFTYSKSDFYSDLKTNIRLSTPIYLLREIAQGEKTPFLFLEKMFQEVATNPIRRNKEKYEYHIKMFHNILKSALRNEIDHIKNNVVVEDRQFLINSFVENLQIINQRYRDLRRIINVPTLPEELINIYLLSDEFMSNLCEKYCFYLIRELENHFPKEYKKNKAILLSLIDSEISYKKKKKYPSFIEDRSVKLGDIIYRRGVLKKYIESQLFLSTRKKKDGLIVEQFLYSMAAGLSMIFATTIAFSFQQKFGNFTMPFFIALVISYMLKDRIKELTRFYLGGKLQKRLFDHKNAIQINNKQSIGWCKESFDFVKEDSLPKNVVKYRNRSQIMEVENRGAEEKIILYRKLLRLNREELNQVYQQYNITGISDVIRFNISKMVTKMDNPKIPVYIPKNDSYELIKGDKLYYLNMVMKFENLKESEYNRYRIVFNRSGIKRVENF